MIDLSRFIVFHARRAPRWCAPKHRGERETRADG